MPIRPEDIRAERNHRVGIGKESYLIGEDGYPMPTRKRQPPPDSRYFSRPQKVIE
jgi:hypothetical protein